MNIPGYLVKLFIVGVMSMQLATTGYAQDKPLSILVYTIDENGFLVTSTLVMGEKDAILIDAQFNYSNAHRVVADVLESGRVLCGPCASRPLLRPGFDQGRIPENAHRRQGVHG